MFNVIIFLIRVMKTKIINYLYLFLFLAVCSCSPYIRYSSDIENKSVRTGNIIKNDQDVNVKMGENDDLSIINGSKRGLASFYSDKFEGKLTASGEVFSQENFTAAHRELPFGTVVRVTRISNGKSVVVRINDRGPFVAGRIIDLSYSAAKAIDLIIDGIAEVEITVIE